MARGEFDVLNGDEERPEGRRRLRDRVRGLESSKHSATKWVARGKGLSGPILTPRDFEVLRFLLDMKFSDREELFDRYFKVTLSGAEATSPEFMRRRLLELESAQLLKRIRAPHQGTQFFIPTPKSYRLMKQTFPDDYFPRPISEIYDGTAFHDRMVSRSRTQIERDYGAVEWTSDLALRSLLPRKLGMKSKYSPDGIYKLPSGERIAFELEIAKKQKSRHREKITEFSRAMREKASNEFMFSKVHFRCLTHASFQMLSTETSIWRDVFKVELVDRDLKTLEVNDFRPREIQVERPKPQVAEVEKVSLIEELMARREAEELEKSKRLSIRSFFRKRL